MSTLLTMDKFVSAYEAGNSKALKPYLDYVKYVCLSKLSPTTPDKDIVIASAQTYAITGMYNARDKFNPERSSFKSYFYQNIIWAISSALKEQKGILEKFDEKAEQIDKEEYKRITTDIEAKTDEFMFEETDETALDDFAEQEEVVEPISESDSAEILDDGDDAGSALASTPKVNRRDPDTIEAQGERQPAIFSRDMMPHLRKVVMNKLDPLKQRIILAAYGPLITPELFQDVDYKLSEHGSVIGYATALSNALAEEGINMTPKQIKSMLQYILKEMHLDEYVSRQAGMARSEFNDNLIEFKVVTKEDTALNTLTNMDVDALSDDEVAWLLTQIFA